MCEATASAANVLLFVWTKATSHKRPSDAPIEHERKTSKMCRQIPTTHCLFRMLVVVLKVVCKRACAQDGCFWWWSAVSCWLILAVLLMSGCCRANANFRSGENYIRAGVKNVFITIMTCYTDCYLLLHVWPAGWLWFFTGLAITIRSNVIKKYSNELFLLICKLLRIPRGLWNLLQIYSENVTVYNLLYF